MTHREQAQFHLTIGEDIWRNANDADEEASSIPPLLAAITHALLALSAPPVESPPVDLDDLICVECGNDLVCQGYSLCSECLEAENNPAAQREGVNLT